ncbi:hypothetical protein A3Q56_01524 [Intoshia linei]|uniref:Mediator of RNA polymerase II transcription subunit 13 n=1 Tax=Intoshia linei TaxID=1819745 RepID=A0A177B8V1_9BILA|nr:hypothetical protein A3Q56_01524 [Intoshia linei]
MNQCSLQDCYTNVFCLCDIKGIRWKCFVSTPSETFDPLNERILDAYLRCVRENLMCVWRRVRAENPGYNNAFCIQLWVFWYKDEPNVIKQELSQEFKILEDGNFETTMNYCCRVLLFKCIHSLIQEHLLLNGFMRFGKWFVKPISNLSKKLSNQPSAISISFSLFLLNDIFVFCFVEMGQHPPIRMLTNNDISLVMRDPSDKYEVMLAPYGIRAFICGTQRYVFKDTFPVYVWKSFFPIIVSSADDDKICVVDVAIGTCRQIYPVKLIAILINGEIDKFAVFNQQIDEGSNSIKTIVKSDKKNTTNQQKNTRNPLPTILNVKSFLSAKINKETFINLTKICLQMSWRTDEKETIYTRNVKLTSLGTNSRGKIQYEFRNHRQNVAKLASIRTLCSVFHNSQADSLILKEDIDRSDVSIFHTIKRKKSCTIDEINHKKFKVKNVHFTNNETVYSPISKKENLAITFSLNSNQTISTPINSIEEWIPPVISVSPCEIVWNANLHPDLDSVQEDFLPFFKRKPLNICDMVPFKQRKIEIALIDIPINSMHTKDDDSVLSDEYIDFNCDLFNVPDVPKQIQIQDKVSEIRKKNESINFLNTFYETNEKISTFYINKKNVFTPLNIFEVECSVSFVNECSVISDQYKPIPMSMDYFDYPKPNGNIFGEHNESPGFKCFKTVSSVLTNFVCIKNFNYAETAMEDSSHVELKESLNESKTDVIGPPLSETFQVDMVPTPKNFISDPSPGTPLNQSKMCNFFTAGYKSFSEDCSLSAQIANVNQNEMENEGTFFSPARNLTKSPFTNSYLYECNSSVALMAIYDTILNDSYDLNFEECTICVCNNGITNPNALLLAYQGINDFPGKKFLLDSDYEPSPCLCAFNLGVYRKIIFFNSVLNQDLYGALNVTQSSKLIEHLKTKQLYGSTCKQLCTPELLATFINQVFSLQTSPFLLNLYYSSFDSCIIPVKTILKLSDQNKAILNALEISLTKENSSSMFSPKSSKLKGSLLHNWAYHFNMVGQIQSKENMFVMLRSLQPLLKEALNKRRPGLVLEDKFNVFGPLTWKDFHLMSGRSSPNETCCSLSHPMILTAGKNDQNVMVHPYAVKYWKSLSLKPISGARKFKYVCITMNQQNIFQFIKSFIEKVANEFLFCDLGKLNPCYIAEFNGEFIQIDGEMVKNLTENQREQKHFDLGTNLFAQNLYMFFNVLEFYIIPILTKYFTNNFHKNLTFVVYIIDTFKFLGLQEKYRKTSTLYLIGIFNKLIKSLPDYLKPIVNLKILPLRYILDAPNWQKSYQSVSFQIYNMSNYHSDKFSTISTHSFYQNSIHLNNRKIKDYQDVKLQRKCKPFILAPRREPVARLLETKTGVNFDPDILSKYKNYNKPAPIPLSNTSFRDDSSTIVLNVAYVPSNDQKLIIVTYTDSTTELLDKFIVNMDTIIDKFNSPVRIAIKRIWRHLKNIVIRGNLDARLVITRLGVMGHNEIKAWGRLINRHGLFLHPSSIKSCNICNEYKSSYSLNVNGKFRSICLLSFIPNCKLIILTDYIKKAEQKFNQTGNNLGTPKDFNSTHIMVFPVSANAHIPCSKDWEDNDHFGVYDGGGANDANKLLDVFPDMEKSIMEADMADILEAMVPATENNINLTPHSNYFNLEDQAESEPMLLEQPMAVGYYVSTVIERNIHSWFNLSNTQYSNNFFNSSPINFKALLHINISRVSFTGEINENRNEKSAQSILDARQPPSVLRFVLKMFNDLSWMTIDMENGKRKSALPIHILMLLELHQSLDYIF